MYSSSAYIKERLIDDLQLYLNYVEKDLPAE